MIRNLMLILMIFAPTILGQELSIENGWKGIQVFKADRFQIENVLGKPSSTNDPIFTIYTIPEGNVLVVYSCNPCTQGVGGKSDYNVPPNTVIEYRVNLVNPVNLSELKWTRANYKIVRDPHRTDVYDYVDSENGVWITVYSDSGVEKVSSLWFRGSKSMGKTVSCTKSK